MGHGKFHGCVRTNLIQLHTNSSIILTTWSPIFPFEFRVLGPGQAHRQSQSVPVVLFIFLFSHRSQTCARIAVGIPTKRKPLAKI